MSAADKAFVVYFVVAPAVIAVGIVVWLARERKR